MKSKFESIPLKITLEIKFFVSLFALILLLQSSPVLADPLPQGLRLPKLQMPNKQVPYNEAGITYFHIYDKGCSPTDYGDGRGETDCHNGNVRSSLVVERGAQIGSSIRYAFDLWITPDLKYQGFFNEAALPYITGGIDSRLRVASWEGNEIHNFIYMLKADNTHGLTFLGKNCQEVKDFGKWVRFSLTVNWSLEPTGNILVSCNNKVIYKRSEFATAINPQCYIANQCEPGKLKYPTEIYFVLGPVMAGFGPDWIQKKKFGMKSQFTDIQDSGIEVRVRNVEISYQ